MTGSNLVPALMASPLFAIVAFSFTASLYLYSQYGSCVIKALRTGKPKECYYLGLLGIAIFAFLFGSTLMNGVPKNGKEEFSE